MDQFNTLKKDFEREVMVKIIVGLRHGTISEERARVLAHDFLDCMSASDGDTFFSKTVTLLEKFSEMIDLYLKYAEEYFIEKRDYLLSIAREYMKAKQYDEAVSALRGELVPSISANQGRIA